MIEVRQYEYELPNSISLLWVCRQIRNEAQDIFYDSTLFRIGAPLPRFLNLRHPRDKTLKPMNNYIFPDFRLRLIRKLRIVIDLQNRRCGQILGRVTDLRYLQAMIGFTEVTIIFQDLYRYCELSWSLSDGHTTPVRALIESIPSTANVKFGVNITSNPGQAYLTLGRLYLNHVPGGDYVRRIAEKQGKLSESIVSHTRCPYGACLDGRRCVNSHERGPPRKSAWRKTTAWRKATAWLSW